MADGHPTPDQEALSKIDTTVPHSARIWNYWMGGKDTYEVDRVAGDAYREIAPNIETMARASRVYLIRTVTFVARELGIRQFLDIGTGLPTYDNTHQVAQKVAPESRIVYVDNDPLVLRHAQALLTSTPEGVTDYVDADARDTDTILREAGKALDLTQPVALVMLGILGNIPDYAEARSIVARLVDAVPSGSYLVINAGTSTSDEITEGARVSNAGGHEYALRTPEEIARYFDGLELLEPGVVPTTRWRPAPDTDPGPVLDGHCGVARKP